MYAAAHSPNAPQEGAADYVLKTDAQGHVVSVALAGSSDERGWSAILSEIQDEASRKTFSVPEGAPGLKITKLPSGARPGHAIQTEVSPAGVGARFDLSDIGGGGGTRVVSTRVTGESALDAVAGY